MSDLHQRLTSAVGNRTYRELGELTAVHPETVRRYMQGQAPSVEFLTGLCRALGLSGSWLLTGEGPMHASDAKAAALGEADAPELLSAMAGTLGGLIDRVGRLEGFVQTLETRVRAAKTSGPVVVTTGPASEEADGEPAEAQAARGPRRIGAAARRPRPDAD